MLLSACASHPPPPCAPAPVTPSKKEARTDAAVLADLNHAVLNGIPRPYPRQFETPDSVLQFVFQKLASRDMAGALVAFPIIERYERVTLKDHLEYVGVYAPSTYPLDDDLQGRLSHSLSSYMAAYRQIGLAILSDQSQGAITVSKDNIQSVLHEFDGERLKALEVVAIEDTHPESPPKVNPIDQALGVTEKVLREVTVKLQSRELVVIALVGRIEENWRVLALFARP